MFAGDSNWVGVAVCVFLIGFRIAELTMQYLMYGAVNQNNWKRIVTLLKW